MVDGVILVSESLKEVGMNPAAVLARPLTVAQGYKNANQACDYRKPSCHCDAGRI